MVKGLHESKETKTVARISYSYSLLTNGGKKQYHLCRTGPIQAGAWLSTVNFLQNIGVVTRHLSLQTSIYEQCILTRPHKGYLTPSEPRNSS